MAINVNTVYKTVLLVLNKEQRGYMTPDEFNKISNQVQREIFERYFEDLNQQSRQPQNDIDYADRLELTEEKLQEFKTSSLPAYDKNNDNFTIPSDLYKLGNVSYRQVNYFNDGAGSTGFVYSTQYKELQRVNRHDFNLIRRSKLVQPSKNYGIFLYEGDKIKVFPVIATQDGQKPIELDYLKKPIEPRWGYVLGGIGQFLYDATTYNTSSLILSQVLTLNTNTTTGLTDGTYTIDITSTATDPVSTSGSSTGGSVTVTVASNTVTSVTVASVGSGFAVGDTITINAASATFPGGAGTGTATIVLTANNLMSASAQGSTDFMLHNSEQSEVILNILLYAGVIIRDPQAVQTALAQVQKDESNEKQ